MLKVQPKLKGTGGIGLYLPEAESGYTNYLEFFCKEEFFPPPLFIYIVIHIFISIWTHAYLYYTLSYNPILCYLSFCTNFSSFGCWELFQAGFVSLCAMALSFCFMRNF